MATTTTEAAEWPKTMRAWTYKANNNLESALVLNEQSPPPPATALSATSVLVQVLYMSVNPADYKLAEMGVLTRAMIAPPASPGMDYSGRVVMAGKDMGAYKPGQLVFGRIAPNKYGTLAGYIVVKDGDGLAHVPEGMETKMAEFASVGTCGLTAYQSIKPYIPENAAERTKVFINAGSGGLGVYGIQIAKALGCHVTTSCSAANVELCKSLGADEVIDYKTQNVSQVLKSMGNFQLVVDNVGASPAKEEDLYVAANAYLNDTGHFIQVGGSMSMDSTKAMAKRSFLPGILGGGKRPWKFILTIQSHADLESLGGLIKSGAVKPVLDEVFTFDKAPEAYKKLKNGRSKGKIVVKVSE